jgi:hypothetical protein
MTTQAISGAAVCAGVVVTFIALLMVAAKAGDKQALRDRIYYELKKARGTLLLTELYVRVHGIASPVGDLVQASRGFYTALDRLEKEGLIESCRCTVREWNVWSAGDGYRFRV